jgi:cystathionine beta-lyase/cystathionine gamma-synthase
MLGFGIAEITLVSHSFGTSPSVKQSLISLYNKSMHASLRKISLGISSTPTDFPNFYRNLASFTSSLSIGLFNSLISMSVQFTYTNVCSIH